MKDIEVVHVKCLVMKSSAEVSAVSATTTDYPNAFAGDNLYRTELLQTNMLADPFTTFTFKECVSKHKLDP